MARASGIAMGMALAAQLGFAQATLPTAYTGPWQTQAGAEPTGWVFHGLGFDNNPDYDGLNNGAAKLDTTGDSISIWFASTAGEVTYWLKGLTFSGGVFQVEQSVDGTNWSAVATYAELPTTPTFKTNALAADARHVRFFYALKGTGNVGLDGITVSAYAPPVPPLIESLVATGGVVRVVVAETTPGRTYVLDQAATLTNAPVVWTQTDSEPGNGGSLTLQDAAPTNAVRYYRVRNAGP